MRLYFIYGWGGNSFMSLGFSRFVDRLRENNFKVDDSVSWAYPDTIAEKIRRNRNPSIPIGLLGHSMGANAITWVAEILAATDVAIDIMIAYDPSMGIGPMGAKPPSVVRNNVRRTICYQGSRPRIAGGASITGYNVETIITHTSHMWLQWDEALHQMTIRALETVRKR